MHEISGRRLCFTVLLVHHSFSTFGLLNIEILDRNYFTRMSLNCCTRLSRMKLHENDRLLCIVQVLFFSFQMKKKLVEKDAIFTVFHISFGVFKYKKSCPRSTETCEYYHYDTNSIVRAKQQYDH